MQKITEEQLLKNLGLSMENMDSNQSIDLNTLDVINDLFERLTSIFPAFKQAWPSRFHYIESQKEWLKAFQESGITNIERIKLGLKKFRKLQSPFVPSPGQFIAMCIPSAEDLGLPSLEKAYEEACKNSHPCETHKKWSHKAVYHAWKQSNCFELRTLSRHQTFPIFKRNYEISCDRVMNNLPLEDIPIALPEKISTLTDKKSALTHLSKIKQLLI